MKTNIFLCVKIFIFLPMLEWKLPPTNVLFSPFGEPFDPWSHHALLVTRISSTHLFNNKQTVGERERETCKGFSTFLLGLRVLINHLRNLHFNRTLQTALAGVQWWNVQCKIDHSAWITLICMSTERCRHCAGENHNWIINYMKIGNTLGKNCYWQFFHQINKNVFFFLFYRRVCVCNVQNRL